MGNKGPDEGQDWFEEEPDAGQEPGPVPPSEPGPEWEGPDIGQYLSDGWNVVIANPVLLIVGCVVISLILAFSVIVVVGPLVLGGPLLFGYVQVVNKLLAGEPAEFGELFDGFKDFKRALVTGLLVFVIALAVWAVAVVPFIVLRLVPCVGPFLNVFVVTAMQICLTAALYFTFPIAVLSGAAPAVALKRSVTFFGEHPWRMLLLGLVTQVIAGAGSIACGVGSFLTVPVALGMHVAAYHKYYLPNVEAEVSD